MGVHLHHMGDLEGARRQYERALAINEKALGAEHPGTALSANNLGSVLQEMGDLQGARRQYERALAIREKGLGPEHPLTRMVRENLASLGDGND
jgi:tetratricopeptide (TPR) repeat protein